MSQTIRMSVPQLGHNGSAESLRQAVGSLEGVDSIGVDVERKTVQVKYDPAKSSADIIKGRIEDQGFTVII